MIKYLKCEVSISNIVIMIYLKFCLLLLLYSDGYRKL
uniref:Uncharacterized protein n=1 Tax=Polysiphonia sp. TaxID=1967842 RepID=A0A1Z1MTK6_9FLOR|nr:hypothetical protein [Polysiphonia sp.]